MKRQTNSKWMWLLLLVVIAGTAAGGRLLWRRMQPIDAPSHFSETLQMDYDLARLRLTLADIQVEKGALAGARKQYDTSRQHLHNAIATVRIIEATKYVDLSRHEDALICLNSAATEWPTNVDILALRIMCMRILGMREVLSDMEESIRSEFDDAADFHVEMLNAAFDREVIPRSSRVEHDRWQNFFLRYLRTGGPPLAHEGVEDDEA